MGTRRESVLRVGPVSLTRQPPGGWRGCLRNLGPGIDPAVQPGHDLLDQRPRRPAGHRGDAAERGGLRQSACRRTAEQQLLDRPLHRPERLLDPRQGDGHDARRHVSVREGRCTPGAALRAGADLAREDARGLQQRLDRGLEPVRLLHHTHGRPSDHLRFARLQRHLDHDVPQLHAGGRRQVPDHGRGVQHPLAAGRVAEPERETKPLRPGSAQLRFRPDAAAAGCGELLRGTREHHRRLPRGILQRAQLGG